MRNECQCPWPTRRLGCSRSVLADAQSTEGSHLPFDHLKSAVLISHGASPHAAQFKYSASVTVEMATTARVRLACRAKAGQDQREDIRN